MPSEQPDLAPDRLVFFTDAVFAISITLLVLDIRLPGTVDLDSNDAVWHALAGITPRILAYLLSFAVVGALWASHHRKYSDMSHHDRTFVRLTILTLMLVAFVPFPSSLIATSDTTPAVVLYSLTMATIGLVSAGTWSYAFRRGFVSRPDRSAARREILAPLEVSVVFGGSLMLLPLGIDNVRYSWVLLFPLLWATH